MPTKPKTRTRSNQKAGRKKHTRTSARAKQRTSGPATKSRASTKRRRAAAKVASRSSSSARATSKPRVEPGESRTTMDLGEIIEWAEARGGAPATVRGTGSEDEEAGILRIDFPGGAGEDILEHISWDEWFEKFQEKGLSFLYQERTKDGRLSRFFKLVKG